MVYYGVSMNTNFLGGNLYTTFVFGALMEVPAVLVVFFVVDRIGRKPLLAGGYLVAALCMLSNLAFTEERKRLRNIFSYFGSAMRSNHFFSALAGHHDPVPPCQGSYHLHIRDHLHLHA